VPPARLRQRIFTRRIARASFGAHGLRGVRARSTLEDMMKILAIAAALSLLAAGAHAETTTCKAGAAQKKLAGAALTSFMKKCQTDAQKACDTQAAEKKLAGAAKASFTKKCVTDAVGN
jgi:hypothetical protein